MRSTRLETAPYLPPDHPGAPAPSPSWWSPRRKRQRQGEIGVVPETAVALLSEVATCTVTVLLTGSDSVTVKLNAVFPAREVPSAKVTSLIANVGILSTTLDRTFTACVAMPPAVAYLHSHFIDIVVILIRGRLEVRRRHEAQRSPAREDERRSIRTAGDAEGERVELEYRHRMRDRHDDVWFSGTATAEALVKPRLIGVPDGQNEPSVR